MPTHPPERAPLLAFGAHPDDIEFGCGGVVALETQSGRPAHLVVCSHGESATPGSPAEGALEFVELDGDAHLEVKAAHAIRLAALLRQRRPAIVLAPSLVENQHPDHYRLGRLVRDAARLARYGGVAELRTLSPHTIDHLFYYALSPDAEPQGVTPLLVDVSAPEVLAAWTAAMDAHATQMRTRNYRALQLARAQVNGLRAGVGHAIALYPNAPPVLKSLAQLGPDASRF
jgi:LmbE family N-acetylglucosaminyl deacetylase